MIRIWFTVDGVFCVIDMLCFFFQAEDGIRDLVRSRGLGDVYKRQVFVIGSIGFFGNGFGGATRVIPLIFSFV